MRRDAPDAVKAFGVDGADNELAAVAVGDVADEPGAGDRRAVDGDLVRSAVKQARGVIQRGYAASDGEGDIDTQGYPLDQLGKRTPVLLGGADIQVDQLVGALLTVADAHFHGVAYFAETLEVDAFDYLSSLDVEAGDYSFSDHLRISSRVMRFS